MGLYIQNHFITDEYDVDVSGGDVILPKDYTYGFKCEVGGVVNFYYLKNFNPNNLASNTVRSKTLTDGEEFFGFVAAIVQSGTTATGITAFSVVP